MTETEMEEVMEDDNVEEESEDLDEETTEETAEKPEVKVEKTNKALATKKEEPKREYVREGSVKAFTSLRVGKPEKLLSVFKSVSKIVDEGIITFRNDGMSIVAMDPANVAMVMAYLPATNFEEYSVAGEKAEYALKFSNLKTVLGRAGKEDSVTVRFGDKVELSFRGKSSRREFGLPLLADIDRKVSEPPKLTPTVEVKLKCKDFEEALADAKIVGESVEFRTVKGELHATSYSENRLDNVDVQLLGTNKVWVDDVKSKYGLEYLEKFITKNEDMTLSFGKDYPLSISTGKDGVALRFILASRVDNS